jgi:hypothetical protein
MQEPFACPDPACGSPARTAARWSWRSTYGPVEHVKTLCDRGHWYTVPVDWLIRRPTPDPVLAAPLPVP